jgi:hypothetical protein
VRSFRFVWTDGTSSIIALHSENSVHFLRIPFSNIINVLLVVLIVGLNVALKGPFPLVGESEVSRESDVSRTDRENYKFIWNTHSKNQSI